jgi:hypothetical protein
MPFYAYSQSQATGGISDDHVYNPLTLSGFPTQARQFQDGDILLMQVETADSQTVSTPAGWTIAPNMPVTNGGTKLTLFWKRLVNPGTTTTVADSGEHQLTRLFCIRGCVETGDPFDVSATNTGTGTTITFPSVTSTTDKGCVILCTSYNSDVIADDLTSPVNSNLENLNVEIGYTDYQFGVGGGMGFLTADFPTAGATGTTTATQANNVEWTSYTAVLKPALIKRPYFMDGFILSAATFALKLRANDIIFAMIETNNEAVSVVTAGYTEVAGSPVINAGTNPTRLTMFWKRTDGTDIAPTFTGPTNHSRVWTTVIRGCVTTGDPFEASYATNTGTGTAVSVGGITTTVANAFVLAVIATTRDANSSFTTFNTWTNADIDDFVPRVDSTTSIGTGGGVALCAGYKAAAGAVGATAVTQLTAVEWAAWMGAFKPEV